MKKVQGNDSFQRINYLYQISKYIVETNPALSSYYGNLMVNVAKKNVLKMHPDIKRQICKKCRCMLINKQTATMKIKRKYKQMVLTWTCNTCGAKKSHPVNKEKEPLWLERPEAIVEREEVPQETPAVNTRSFFSISTKKCFKSKYRSKPADPKHGANMKIHILILAALLTAVSLSKKNKEPSDSSLKKDLLALLKKSFNLNIQGSPAVQVDDVDLENLGGDEGQSFHLKESDELQEEPTILGPKFPSEKTLDYKFKSSGQKKYLDVEDDDVIQAKKFRELLQARSKDKLNNNKEMISSRYKDDRVSDKSIYRMDPVMNNIRMKMKRSGRRAKDSESSDSSSSRELKEWKQEWNEVWMSKKLEALNTSAPRGDMLNMVAARPWGVPCGDPNKHDMPWGTCMLAAECDSEFRIYRGDYFCGRTHFICCALQTHTYDLYQGFDVSFEDSSFETEENEGKSKEKKRRRREKAKKRRKRIRDQRKKKIKKQIKKIVRDVERILNKAYKNGTIIRKKKTKTLKKYIKYLKKKYRKDRDTVKDIHEVQMIKVDAEIMKRIMMVKDVNRNFMQNATFRDIIEKGEMTSSGARMLVGAYPELAPYIGVDNTRRAGGGPAKDYLDYDIEYGLLFS